MLRTVLLRNSSEILPVKQKHILKNCITQNFLSFNIFIFHQILRFCRHFQCLIFRCQSIEQTCKKIIFVREPGYGTGNVRIIYLDEFATKRGIKVYIMVFTVKILWNWHSFEPVFTKPQQNFDFNPWMFWILKNVRIFLQKCPGTRFPGSRLFACLLGFSSKTSFLQK